MKWEGSETLAQLSARHGMTAYFGPSRLLSCGPSIRCKRRASRISSKGSSP